MSTEAIPPAAAAAGPLAWLRRIFERDTAGEWIFPLVVLSALYFFDEFDTAAFGTLSPDIEKAFHLSDKTFVSLVTLNVAVVVLLAVPVGYLADRVKRTPLVVISGLVAGVFSLLTGFAPTVALITLARFGNGLGLLANGPIHNSLLADYYTPRARPGAFANHTNAVYIGGIVGPLLAGVLGYLFTWRAAFYVLIVPIVIVAFIATRLPEPVRGSHDRGTALVDPMALGQKPPAFRQAARILMSMKTLRYQYLGAVSLGAGLIPLVVYLALFYQRSFHIGPFGRGVFGALNAGATFLGVRHGGKRTPGWFAKGIGRPLRYAGLTLSVTGVGIALQAAAPWLALVIALGLATSYVIGYFFAPYYAVMALVSPARVRSLSFSFVAIFLVIGVLFFYATGLASVSDNVGIRAGIAVLAPFWILAGAILAYTERFVADDVNRALAMLTDGTEASTGPKAGDDSPDDPTGHVVSEGSPAAKPAANPAATKRATAKGAARKAAPTKAAVVKKAAKVDQASRAAARPRPRKQS
ncbi:MAG: MFS transporter [Acidimicrobiales bacterium]